MKLQFFDRSLKKMLKTNFLENLPSGSRDVSCGKSDGRTDMKKLIVVFRSFEIAPKNALVQILKKKNRGDVHKSCT